MSETWTGSECFELNPLEDPRWAEFVQRQPEASVFQTVPWLRLLRETYGYTPRVYTRSAPGRELTSGIVACEINSWLTGKRLVSLPFSDHCEPLCEREEDLRVLIEYISAQSRKNNWKYVELRPAETDLGSVGDAAQLGTSAKYAFHRMDLRPELGEVFRTLDKDSLQRRITRAGKAGLEEKRGRSPELVRDFYEMFVKTRSRQRVPPIPMKWFRNLVELLGEAVEIRGAYVEGQAIAAIVTLRFREKLYYKYGCSDAQFNKYGATPWLLWRAAVDGKQAGATVYDLGRTQDDGSGLLKFKNHWVQPSEITYWRYPRVAAQSEQADWKSKMAKRVFPYVPDRVLTMVGELLYRHMG